MRDKRYLLLALLPLTISACSPTHTEPTSPSTSEPDTPIEEPRTVATISIDGDEDGQILTPEEVTLKDTLHSIESQRFYNTQVLPSTGDVNILVIPVLIDGYTDFTEAGLPESMPEEEKLKKVRDDIGKAFFGEEGETGFESVASYYKKSSLGNLRLSGTVTDWFDMSKHSEFTSAGQLNNQTTQQLVQDAVDWALTTQNVKASDLDSDDDGFIDGVWLVYSAEDYTRDGPMTDDQNFWAYTSWGNQDAEPDVETSEYYYNLFGWASYDFMYDAYGTEVVDPHTFIHETGHFLGLNDYYSDRPIYNPVGKVDMMDGNIADQNAYSKMLLGWAKPYVVTGDATIDLESMEQNQLIVIPPDGTDLKGGVFDPFSEYLVIELYTPDGLNLKDSEVQVPDRPLAMDQPGVRIYHVDNRRYVTHWDRNQRLYVTEEDDGDELKDGESYILPITNSIAVNQYVTALNLDYSIYPYDEIRMIESEGINTFSSGGFQTRRTLFTAGDTFSLKKYSDFFIHRDTLDSGKALSAEVRIDAIDQGVTA